ncbi:MAG: hypothetical protein JXO49_02615 [Deltaproteobacteria bacterium]|nr:hypothetical protein [Candidatus Anaeroferrophillus wilburensis]MBN2888221.1 hypothetical protein [Deltaproteobacteria bacterium]
MAHLIEKSHFSVNPEGFGADRPVETQENFIKGIFSSVDETTADGLDRLRTEEGITPTCKLGCCHCCRFHILTNSAEAHTLAQYVKRTFSGDQINGLQMRTRQWHAWDNSRPGRHLTDSFGEQVDIENYVPYCPLLVKGACSAYPVRPVVCRTHFVSSPSLFCRAASDPQLPQEAPVVLMAVVTAAQPFSMAIRKHIEHAGLDFPRSQMLLPQWLAIEMDWDFAIGR